MRQDSSSVSYLRVIRTVVPVSFPLSPHLWTGYDVGVYVWTQEKKTRNEFECGLLSCLGLSIEVNRLLSLQSSLKGVKTAT